MKLKSLLKNLSPHAAQISVVFAILTTGVIAYNLGAVSPESKIAPPAATEPHDATHPAHPLDLNGDGILFTCSMHPQILQDEPVDCPLCGMDLVAIKISGNAESSGSTGVDRQLVMSVEAAALADIQTTEATLVPVRKTIRLTGQLAVDPSRRAHISADVGGRIDRLYAKFEGDRVKKGETLALFYSPELLAVQLEYLQAIRSLQRTSANAPASILRASEGAVRSTRERLRLAGLTTEQIDALKARGEAKERVELKAPLGGTVTVRHVEEGQYVAKGGMILEIVDLNALWAELEAYENDLAWLKTGQQATLRTAAYPGREFKGEVAWIDPLVTPATRTINIRIDLANEDGVLKPGMYVTGTVETELDGGPQLTIPSSAALITGKRAVAYVAIPGADSPIFEGREIELGSKTENGYIVLAGLKADERVVTQGAFKIDSAMEILAKPSMMNPPKKAAPMEHEMSEMPEAYKTEKDNAPLSREALARTLPQYIEIQRGLWNDDFDRARRAWTELQTTAQSLQAGALSDVLANGNKAADLTALRAAFKPLSVLMAATIAREGNPSGLDIQLAHCPMAFDNAGADWLQSEEDIYNPYFGDEMLYCGSIEKEYPAQ